MNDRPDSGLDCPICGSGEVAERFELTAGHRIRRCGRCGVEFLYPQLSDEKLDKLYSETYFAAWGVAGEGDNTVTRQMKMATFRLRLKVIRRFVGTGSILDVGCATGYFLELAKEEGYEPYGVEYSSYAAGVAQQRLGKDRIYRGILETAEFAPNSFSVIAMSDLIEHVRDPRQTLTRAGTLLLPDGVILLMTPDTGSISNQLMGKRWTHYKPEHFYYFSRRSMELLAKSCGLEMVYYERCKKALTIDYLYTQFRVYRHWLLTPLIGVLHRLLPRRMTARNFYVSIGEMVVILKKKE